MTGREQHIKPDIGQWVRAGDVLACRLIDCVHVYKRDVDVFMPASDRQKKADRLGSFLRRLHSALDLAEMPFDQAKGPEANDEQVIAACAGLFREALVELPRVSQDMQKLLASSWMKNFPSKAAETLFCGTESEDEGIGSGVPDHGRLPAVLASLLEREEMGEERPARSDVLFDEPRRHDIDNVSRWVEQNAAFLRTAGRVQ